MPLSLLIRNNIDAEACAYLYTAGLTAPMDHHWGQIYLYVASKTYARNKDKQVPEDIQAESLNDYQMSELNRLKGWLYRQHTRVRQESERAERRQAEMLCGKTLSQENVKVSELMRLAYLKIWNSS